MKRADLIRKLETLGCFLFFQAAWRWPAPRARKSPRRRSSATCGNSSSRASGNRLTGFAMSTVTGYLGLSQRVELAREGNR
jgi:hypothetical protein